MKKFPILPTNFFKTDSLCPMCYQYLTLGVTDKNTILLNNNSLLDNNIYYIGNKEETEYGYRYSNQNKLIKELNFEDKYQKISLKAQLKDNNLSFQYCIIDNQSTPYIGYYYENPQIFFYICNQKTYFILNKQNLFYSSYIDLSMTHYYRNLIPQYFNYENQQLNFTYTNKEIFTITDNSNVYYISYDHPEKKCSLHYASHIFQLNYEYFDFSFAARPELINKIRKYITLL